jgi:hypothetical protein
MTKNVGRFPTAKIRSRDIPTLKNYKVLSIIKELRKQDRSNEQFEIMVGNLSLEELIQLKLELSAKVGNRPLYGFKILNILRKIITYSVVKFYLQASSSFGQAAILLGLKRIQLLTLAESLEFEREEWIKYRTSQKRLTDPDNSTTMSEQSD